MNTVLYVLFAVLVLEAALGILIPVLRKDFQWLITEQDERPVFDKSGLEKFFQHGYDRVLGWDRKPGTSKDEEVKTLGEERRQVMTARYTINSVGARSNPGHEHLPVSIVSYGDSFAFSRHVNDTQTWQWYLSELTQTNVVNLGVGNYGLDQALIKMKRELPGQSPKIALMMGVPETISRIVNVWKHYSEYGNTFGFKGRFFEKDGRLEWMDNPVSAPQDFERISDLLPGIQQHDFCYAHKFLKDKLSFPYLVSLGRNPGRHIPLIASLVVKSLLKRAGIQNETLINSPWEKVLRRNFALTRSLYGNPEIVSLLKQIILEFGRAAEVAGAVPVFLFVPYLHDLYEIRRGNRFYKAFIDSIKTQVRTMDFGEVFANVENPDSLYVSSFYGAHLSEDGNRRAAEALHGFLVREELSLC